MSHVKPRPLPSAGSLPHCLTLTRPHGLLRLGLDCAASLLRGWAVRFGADGDWNRRSVRTHGSALCAGVFWSFQVAGPHAGWRAAREGVGRCHLALGVCDMDQSARSAVLVRVQGPDPKGTKRNDQSFSLFDAGITTLSASGTILPVGDRLVVVTSANVLRPFLTQKNKCEPRSSPTALALSLT